MADSDFAQTDALASPPPSPYKRRRVPSDEVTSANSGFTRGRGSPCKQPRTDGSRRLPLLPPPSPAASARPLSPSASLSSSPPPSLTASAPVAPAARLSTPRASSPSEAASPTSKSEQPAPSSAVSAPNMTTDGRGYAWRGATEYTPGPPGPLLTFAIERRHPLVPVWPPLRDAIEAALEERAYPWCALEVFRRRRFSEPEKGENTTVMITGQWLDEAQRQAAQDIVRDLCIAHGQSGLRIEVLDGTIEYHARTGDSISSAEASADQPRMGSSISVKGLGWAGGTLGGCVELKRDGQDPISAILTCHHVLRPTRTSMVSNPDEVAGEYDATLDRMHVGHPAVTEELLHCRVQAPSARKAAIRLARNVVALAERGFHLAELRRQFLDGMFDERLRRRITATRGQVATCLDLLAQAYQADYDVGHVLATSGYRTAPGRGCALDWGLVRARPSHVGGNEVPRMSQPLQDFLPPYFRGVDDLDQMELGDQLVMFGAESGPSFGTYSFIDPRVMLPGQKGERTTEAVVVPSSSAGFAQGGDSGAFVVNSRGLLVGILIGGPSGAGHTGHGYVTPVESIITDVEEQTGYKLDLPVL